MRLGITAAAVAGALVVAAASAATATPLVNIKGAAGTAPGAIDLVRSGTGFGGIGHGGGPHMGGMAMRGGNPGAMAGRSFKGAPPSVYRGGGGGKSAYKGGGNFKGGNYAYKGGNYAYKGGNYAYKGGGKYKGGNYAYKNYRGNYAWNGSKGHGRHHRNYYPYFWPGLAYGGVGIYSGYGYGGCGWLYSRAQATGSPYWWQRYQDCVYGY